MMPETIKLVFPVISHTTFDTFSSLTLGGSSGASGDDNLGKINQYMILSHIRHGNGKGHTRADQGPSHILVNECGTRVIGTRNHDARNVP